MLNPKLKIKYNAHWWQTDVTGQDENGWESAGITLIYFPKQGKLESGRPYRVAVGFEWIVDLGDPAKGISSNKINAVAGQIQAYLEKNLELRRELVNEIVVGEKTLVMRIAVSNIYAKRPTRKVRNFLPIGLVATGVKKAAGSDYVLSTAVLEAEAIDGQTGEVIGAIVSLQLGKTLADAKTGERKWEDIQAHLREYADTLRDRFGVKR